MEAAGFRLKAETRVRRSTEDSRRTVSGPIRYSINLTAHLRIKLCWGLFFFFKMIFEGCFCSTAFLCMRVSLLHRTCWGRCSHRSLRGPRIAWPWPADFDFSADGEVLKFYILCKSVTSYCTTRVWRLSSPSVACSQVFSLHASALLSLTHLKPRVLTGFFWLTRRNTAQMALGSNSATISPVRVQFKKDVVLFIRL